MINDKINHFQIEDKLGAGGMGVVYKALDLKLNRYVAIKALAHHIAQNPDYKKRFLHEAQAAASLNHPNITTIYETVDEGSDAYIVMEFIEGEELSKKINEKKFETAEALEVAIQIAEGVSDAHKKGIIHRDIKSQNIMITESGRAKIMDFGLAKLSGQTMMTQLGTTVGTINYMSPEQSRGENVDARTDIWTLGVVLYEMLTGQLPFKGDYEAAVVYSILNEKPKPASAINTKLIPEIDELINKVLAKNPDERYQSADELLADLKSIKKSIELGIPVEMIKSKLSVADYISQSKTQIETALPKKKKRNRVITAAGFLILLIAAFIFKGKDIIDFFGIELIPSAKHLAVLPFEIIGGGPEDNAFSAGLLETITSKLSQLEQFEGKLWVVPSSEIRKAKVTEVTDAVNKYGVNLALTGSIQKMEKGYRVTINLIDGETKRQLASRMMDDPLTSNSVIQDEAVIKVADMLKIELKPEMKKTIATGGTENAEAYRLYLIGKGQLANSTNTESLISSRKTFEEAIGLDSLFALAYTSKAEVENLLLEKTKETNWMNEAISSFSKAREIEKNLIEANLIEGKIYNLLGKYQEANLVFQKVLEQAPNNYDAYIGKAKSLKALGFKKDAEQLFKKAIQLKPDFYLLYTGLGLFYYQEGRYKEAAEQFQKVVELVPNNAGGYRNLASMNVFLNNIQEATQLYQKSLSIESDYRTYANLAAIQYKAGKYVDAAATYEKVIEMRNTDYRMWGYLAYCYYRENKNDKSNEANKKAISLAELELKINPKNTEVLASMASYYAMIGDLSNAKILLKKIEKFEIQSVDTYFSVGSIYEEFLHDRDNALKWIRTAIKKGYPLNEVNNAFGLKNLRQDPRYENILRSK